MKSLRLKPIKLSDIKLHHIFEFFICIFYTWYFLPVCQALLWGGIYNVIFFSFFLIGTLGLIFLKGFRMNMTTLPVMIYMIVFSALFLAGIGDADAHIRVSFTFWGTALLYFSVLDNGGRIRIGKYLLVLFAITLLTSSIGVILDNRAARTIAHAAADDELQRAYKLKNISSIYFFQGMVMLVPLLLLIPKKRKTIFWSIIGLLLIFVVLFSASFTIALIVYFAAIIFSLVMKMKLKSRVILLIALALIGTVIVVNGAELLTFLGDSISNTRISERMYSLRDVIYLNENSGDAAVRMEQYSASWNTFLGNVFGIGVHYSYTALENGIGYHSQFLDDLARYGLVGLAFYAVLIIGYWRQLRAEWSKLGVPQIATVVTVIYATFLVLNLGFRSADESIIVFFIMPVIPLMISEYKNRRNKLEEVNVVL